MHYQKNISLPDRINMKISLNRIYNAPVTGVNDMGYLLYCPGWAGDHSVEDWIRGNCALLPERPDVITPDPEGLLGYGLGVVCGLFQKIPRGKEDVVLLPCPIRGIRGTVLGWSAGHKVNTRFRGSIMVPDRRSLELLRSAGLERKVRLGPDLSFLVERRLRPLSGAFRRDTVGVCPGGGEWPYALYLKLIDNILANTSMEIALIPYDAKDVPVLHVLAQHYRHNSRVRLRPDGDSQVLRGDLSLCRCVVGLSGAVAAWSCGVPALCLRPGARELGLAADLFDDWQDVVVQPGELCTPGALTERLRRFLQREAVLRRKLECAVVQRREFALQWKHRLSER